MAKTIEKKCKFSTNSYLKISKILFSIYKIILNNDSNYMRQNKRLKLMRYNFKSKLSFLQTDIYILRVALDELVENANILIRKQF